MKTKFGNIYTIPFQQKKRVREVIAKSLSKQRLNLEEVAVLINANDPESIHEIKEGAKQLKKTIYGNRIVLFAPLYVGNKCTNNCLYCGFRATNKEQIRKTLSDEELIHEIEALEDNGQKRLILVYGEHPEYNAEYLAHTVEIAYSVKKGKGEIRRVNINAAPLDIEGFRTVKKAGIRYLSNISGNLPSRSIQRLPSLGQKKPITIIGSLHLIAPRKQGWMT